MADKPTAIPRKPVPQSTPPSSFPVRLLQHTRSLRRLYLFLILAAVLALLALIIGLAVGLTRRHGSNLPIPGRQYTGDLTYYTPALGACGITSSENDIVVSIAHATFDAAQSGKGTDPNANPLCGRKIRARLEGRGSGSVDLTVVDRCVGCKPTDIDVSPAAFRRLADPALGRVRVKWGWL